MRVSRRSRSFPKRMPQRRRTDDSAWLAPQDELTTGHGIVPPRLQSPERIPWHDDPKLTRALLLFGEPPAPVVGLVRRIRNVVFSSRPREEGDPDPRPGRIRQLAFGIPSDSNRNRMPVLLQCSRCKAGGSVCRKQLSRQLPRTCNCSWPSTPWHAS